MVVLSSNDGVQRSQNGAYKLGKYVNSVV